uniref:putative vomeronasal receptor-like protein 4 n=1 Tax=Jaculus jaculus TaxID=51337 RepID=UPI001E1B0061|nr:putative vomeronasal receptor-like protein 4 [Jaculus jaculus]
MVWKIIKISIFLLLTGFGTVGNIYVLMNYMYTFLMDTDKKSLQFILIHLSFANIAMLLSKAVSTTAAALGLRNVLDETGCHIIVYLNRVARGFSICTSSLLTVVQAIAISPGGPRCGKLKIKSARHIPLVVLFFWVLNSLVSMNLLHPIRNRNTNISHSKSNNYCYFKLGNQEINNVFLTLMALRDVVFLGVMGGASGYMVLLLHRHHQHVLYLRNPKLLHQTPPELRAARSVLLLMLCFLFFYWTDCVISLYLTFSLKNISITMHVQEFLTLGYAIISPFVLIHRDGHLIECWHTW